MQITRGNYSQYANMVQQMFGNKKNPNNPLDNTFTAIKTDSKSAFLESLWESFYCIYQSFSSR